MWLFLGISLFLLELGDIYMRAKGGSLQMRQKEIAQKRLGKYWQVWYFVIYTLLPFAVATFLLVMSIIFTVKS